MDDHDQDDAAAGSGIDFFFISKRVGGAEPSRDAGAAGGTEARFGKILLSDVIGE